MGLEVGMVSMTVCPKTEVILIWAGRMSACSLMEVIT